MRGGGRITQRGRCWSERRLLAKGLFAAIALHGAYDLFLLSERGFAAASLLVLAVELWWGRRLLIELREEQLFGPLQPARPAPRRTLRARAKLVAGALVTTAGALFALASPLTALDPQDSSPAAALLLVGLAALLVALCGVKLFASGLRGPFTAPAPLPVSA